MRQGFGSKERRRDSRADDRLVTGAVIYARVSSREQEEEGFSLDAQLRLLRDYAAKHEMTVATEFIEAQTAKVVGRKAFGEMVDFLTANPQCAILVEKTDRLYRNIRDWVTIEDLGATLHFVREGQIIGPDSRSSDKLIHGFKVLMARNYVDNLSEEIRKGMREKILQGLYPSHAPLGYLNAMEAEGRRKIIVPDPDRAGLVQQVFDEFDKGLMSLRQLMTYAGKIGLRTKKGNRLSRMGLYKLLTNPAYCGQIAWKGEVVPGAHEPLVSAHQFQRCQKILHGRAAKRSGYGDIPFAYRGLIRCACGQIMSGEIKKGRYIYYHCQGARDTCGRPYVKEETLTAAIRQILAKLQPPPIMTEWLRRAVILSHEARMEFQVVQQERLEAEIMTARQKLERLYLDKVAGDLSTETYRRLRSKFEGELCERQTMLESYQLAGDRSADDSLATLELAIQALARFDEGDALERNATLRTLLSNCIWDHDTLRVELHRPFDLLLKANQEPLPAAPDLGSRSGQSENWWRLVDALRTGPRNQC